MQHNLHNTEVRTIGHYEIRHKIAEGGFGVVYHAHDTRLHRDVAIKLLHPYNATDPTRVARFLREARGAAKLQHPGIVQIHDILEEHGRMALVMELVDGVTLDRYLKNHPELRLEDKLDLAAQVAETLHVAHEAGIIHRDVKPANILVDGMGRTKLTDFSLARLVDTSMSQLTGENNVLGTPSYMSPEQCEGKNATAQSDLYSLGVVIYEMTTGARPFEAESYLGLMRHHMDTPPTPIRLLKPMLPLVLEEVIMQCLSKKPEERPESGLTLAHQLREIAAELRREFEIRATTRTVELRVLPSGGDPSRDDTIDVRSDLEQARRPAPLPPQAEPPPLAFSPAAPHPDSGSYPKELVEQPDTRAEAQEDMAKPTPASAWLSQIRRLPLHMRLGVALLLLLAAVGVFSVLSRTRAREAAKGAIDLVAPSLWSETPLLDYVNKPDDNYKFSLATTIRGESYAAYVIDMTSQAWFPDKVSPPVWQHWLTIIVPDKVASSQALLVLAQSDKGMSAPMQAPETLREIALASKTIVAILDGFPRTPLRFFDEETTPTRDEFAVASFAKFLETGDPKWPIVCPITKAVVRAMDTIQKFETNELGLETPVERFVLTGSASGWGAWLTGAVDSRVAAIAPIGFDMLRIGQQIEHQVGLRSEFPPFLALLSDTGVMPQLDTANGERLLKIIDPYEYRDKLTMPKLLLLPASGGMGAADAVSLFIGELKGDTFVHYAPNFSPTMMAPLLAQPEAPVRVLSARPLQSQDGAQNMVDSLRGFYHKLMVDKAMPKYKWTTAQDGAFSLDARQSPPAEARLWIAKSSTQDFRYETIGDAWQMERLKDSLQGVYEGQVKADTDMYQAYYIELIYPSKLGVSFSLSTPITIISPQKPTKQYVATETAKAAPKRANGFPFAF